MRQLEIDWQESEAELGRLWKREQHPERRLRLRTLCYLRQGQEIKAVSQKLGIAYRTLQYWIAWYRQGGLTEVLKRIKGHGHQGTPAYLTLAQEASLCAEVGKGQLGTVAAVCATIL